MLRRLTLIFLVIALAMLTLAACRSPLQRKPAANPSQTAESKQLLTFYSADRQMQDIATLVSRGLEGRAAGTDGEDKAGGFLTKQMEQLGLQPWSQAGLDGYRQSFPVARRNEPAENLIGVMPGTDHNSYLIVSAHYDHLGVKQGAMYRGADDNAAGVAAALELARSIKDSGTTPKRTIVFAFLSGEETGLHGSKALAERMVRFNLHTRAAVINLDMLGGTGGKFVDIWKERSGPKTNQLASSALQAAQATGVQARIIRRRFGPVDSRSFARKGMPAITVSWHMDRRYHPYRHTTKDTADNLRPELLSQATKAALAVAWDAANR